MTEQQYPTASAGALIFDPENRIFLMRSHKWRNKYQVPGGKIELGERIEDALRREIKEETGLYIDHIEFICFQESIFDEAFYVKKHMIFFDFSCRTDSTDVQLNDEAQKFVWISLDEALELPLDPYTRKLIHEYLAFRKIGIG